MSASFPFWAKVRFTEDFDLPLRDVVAIVRPRKRVMAAIDFRSSKVVDLAKDEVRAVTFLRDGRVVLTSVIPYTLVERAAREVDLIALDHRNFIFGRLRSLRDRKR